MRRRNLLTSTQRERATQWATSSESVARHYRLNPADYELIGSRRRASNRLGFGLHLCCLRFPGHAWLPGEPVPGEVLGFVSEQLGVSPAELAVYAGQRLQTHYEHMAEAQQALGLQPFTTARYRDASRRLITVAMDDDRPTHLVNAVMADLRRQRITLPRITVIERMCFEVRGRARRRVYHALTHDLPGECRERLDGLLTAKTPAGLSHLSWVRQLPSAASASNMLGLTERVSALRTVGIESARADRVSQGRRTQLAREGQRATAQHLLELEPPRRHATLVATVVDLSETLTDGAMNMFERLIARMFNKAERRRSEDIQRDARTMYEKVLLYARVGRGVIEARAGGADPYHAIERCVGWDRFEATVEEAEALTRREPSDVIGRLGAQYTTLRRYAPAFLATFDFKGISAVSDLLEAINMLHVMNVTRQRKLPADAPTSFVQPRWRPYVFHDDGIDRRYYEICVLSELRDRLRAGDVWVPGSRHYRELEDHLVSAEDFEDLRATGEVPVAVELDADRYLAERKAQLHERLSSVEALAQTDRLEGVTLAGRDLRFAPVRTGGPRDAERLADRLYGLLPLVRITELLEEVDGWTHFTEGFTHLRRGTVARDKRTLLTAVLADATNLGLSRMADACGIATRRQLVWASSWHIRDETYAQALAQLVNAHHQHPFAAWFGSGTTSTSDGQYFKVGGPGMAAGEVNAHYGSDPTVALYTHLSDQYGPFQVKVLSATAGEAPHVLDGLLHHHSDLRIHEHHTDTGGVSDHVFALCHLLGFRFAPRIRDLKDRRLYSFESASEYPGLEPLIAGRINERLIREQWPEILRLATSIRNGTVTASLVLRRLGAYPKRDNLAKALRELGRLERTLFTLNWLDDPLLRRRASVELNKGEARNTLARAVCFHRLGKFRDRSYDNQRYRASGLNLVVAAIILWNTTYLQRAVASLERHEIVPADLLRHISPLGWEHINLTGDYLWDTANSPDSGAYRDLREPFYLAEAA